MHPDISQLQLYASDGSALELRSQLHKGQRMEPAMKKKNMQPISTESTDAVSPNSIGWLMAVV